MSFDRATSHWAKFAMVIVTIVHSDNFADACAPARLADGPDGRSGRIEIYMNEEWGSICDDLWDINDGHAACRHLGFGAAESVQTDAFYGEGEGPIQMTNLSCKGTEDFLLDCDYRGSTEKCSHSEDAGVVCTPVRLSDGLLLDGRSGRVEVFVDGEWVTVRHDGSWDINGGDVVCRQVGFSGAESVDARAFYGRSNATTQLSNVSCTGAEASLLECGFDSPTGDFSHREDAGVVCRKNIRLAGGPSRHSGRVEVYRNGEWGTVCDDTWSVNLGDLVCQQLGYSRAKAVHTHAFYGAGEGPVHMDELRCGGAQRTIFECRFEDSSTEDCTHYEDAGVECALVRLADGPDGNSGRVEVYLDYQWGTVCDDSWDIDDGHVVCRQLGFPGAESVQIGAFYGGSVFDGPIQMDDVRCTGTEASLLDCRFDPKTRDCMHNQDAGVVCVPVRLADGSTRKSGRVEVFRGGRWGTVCDYLWDIEDGHVVCRQLGFQGAESVQAGAFYGRGKGPVQLDAVRCTGTECSLLHCWDDDSLEDYCNHRRDAGVVCY